MKKEANVSKGTRELVVTAMMVAIMEILVWTPVGMIIIPPISVTVSHIPIIVCALLEGPLAGAFVGLAFGVTTMVRAATSPNFLDLLFLNPLISVLPRMLIAFTSYYSFVLLRKVLGGLFSKGNVVSCFIAGCIGSMTNTVGCLGMLYLIYAKRILDEIGTDAGNLFIGIVTGAGLIEMLVVAVIVTAVTPAVMKVFYRV